MFDDNGPQSNDRCPYKEMDTCRQTQKEESHEKTEPDWVRKLQAKKGKGFLGIPRSWETVEGFLPKDVIGHLTLLTLAFQIISLYNFERIKGNQVCDNLLQQS